MLNEEAAVQRIFYLYFGTIAKDSMYRLLAILHTAAPNTHSKLLPSGSEATPHENHSY